MNSGMKELRCNACSHLGVNEYDEEFWCEHPSCQTWLPDAIVHGDEFPNWCPYADKNEIVKLRARMSDRNMLTSFTCSGCGMDVSESFHEMKNGSLCHSCRLNGTLRAQITALQSQVDALKCCGNCEHYVTHYEDRYCDFIAKEQRAKTSNSGRRYCEPYSKCDVDNWTRKESEVER